MCIYGPLLQIETLQYKICSYPFCTKEVTSNALWYHNMSFLIPKFSREVYNILVGIGHHGPERKSTSLLASVYFHKANTVDFSHLTLCAFVQKPFWRANKESKQEREKTLNSVSVIIGDQQRANTNSAILFQIKKCALIPLHETLSAHFGGDENLSFLPHQLATSHCTLLSVTQYTRAKNVG